MMLFAHMICFISFDWFKAYCTVTLRSHLMNFGHDSSYESPGLELLA